MPVKLTGRHYGNNVGYCDTLFSSFRHFGLGDVFSEFLVVVVPSEAETVRKYAEAWSDFPIRIVSEDELLPVFRRYNRPHQVRPWHRQQMIKMACSTIVESDTYLSLDPDVIAVKRVDSRRPHADGLPLLDPETRSYHPEWWIDSGRLLGVEPNLEQPGVHATPILYRSEVWARCFSRLEELQKKPWAEALITAQGTWTEMALYYLTLENFFDPTPSIGSGAKPGCIRRLSSGQKRISNRRSSPSSSPRTIRDCSECSRAVRGLIPERLPGAWPHGFRSRFSRTRWRTFPPRASTGVLRESRPLPPLAFQVLGTVERLARIRTDAVARGYVDPRPAGHLSNLPGGLPA